MAVAGFEELCAAYCELAGVPPPKLAEDAMGRVGFHVVLRGRTVNIVHCPHDAPAHVFLLFEFGPLADIPLPDPRDLLEANFQLLRPHAPVFSVNPASGVAVMQQELPLFDATAHGLQQSILEGLEAVQGRIAGHRSGEPPHPRSLRA